MRLVFEVSPELAQALGSYVITVDKTKFAQVIRNLLSNALKFTPAEGSVTIDVSALYPESGAAVVAIPGKHVSVHPPAVFSRLQLSVTDTGAGISKVRLRKICK